MYVKGLKKEYSERRTVVDRREFIKLAAYASIGTFLLPGCSTSTPRTQQAAQSQSGQGIPSDLVIVEGNDLE